MSKNKCKCTYPHLGLHIRNNFPSQTILSTHYYTTRLWPPCSRPQNVDGRFPLANASTPKPQRHRTLYCDTGYTQHSLIDETSMYLFYARYCCQRLTSSTHSHTHTHPPTQIERERERERERESTERKKQTKD